MSNNLHDIYFRIKFVTRKIDYMLLTKLCCNIKKFLFAFMQFLLIPYKMQKKINLYAFKPLQKKSILNFSLIFLKHENLNRSNLHALSEVVYQ